MDLKAELVASAAHPPLHHSLPDHSTSSILDAVGSCHFDVILINPLSTWEETAALPIKAISADPGFVFLWVGRGDGDGLEKGRECFAKWGFRRAEDIVWVKTNKSSKPKDKAVIRGNPEADGDEKAPGRDEEGQAGPSATGSRGLGGGGLLSSSKEHCLMGIRGTVRRSTDTRFVHCNVDTDVMVWEDEGGELVIFLQTFTLIQITT